MDFLFFIAVLILLFLGWWKIKDTPRYQYPIQSCIGTLNQAESDELRELQSRSGSVSIRNRRRSREKELLKKAGV